MKRAKSTYGLAKLGDVLPQLMTKYGLHRRQNVDEISDVWKAAVGSPYDEMTSVVGLSRGTLQVTVRHPAFVQELSFRQAELLQTIQTALPDEKIKRIKLTTR